MNAEEQFEVDQVHQKKGVEINLDKDFPYIWSGTEWLSVFHHVYRDGEGVVYIPVRISKKISPKVGDRLKRAVGRHCAGTTKEYYARIEELRGAGLLRHSRMGSSHKLGG